MTAQVPGKRALVFVATIVLLDVIGFGLILPVLPRLLVELTGDTLSEAAIDGGWLAFVYAGMQFVFSPVLGNLSDRFGRRPVLLCAVGALGIDYLVMGVAPTLGWLFLGRTIAGIAGASFTPAYAYIADVSPPEKRAQSFGVVAAAFGIGFILGPALGGLLGELDVRAPFFAAAGLSLLNFTYGLFALPESLPPESRRPFEWRRANPLGTLAEMRKHSVVLRVLAALFLWMVAHQVMPATWTFYTKLRFGWSEAMIGASLALAGLVMALSQATLMRLVVPRVGERRAALAGIAVASIGYLGYATATAGWMMFAWLATWFVGALVMPSSNALMSHRIAKTAQGELQGAVASLFSLSSIVGPPIMTHLFRLLLGAARARARAGGGLRRVDAAGLDLLRPLLHRDTRARRGRAGAGRFLKPYPAFGSKSASAFFWTLTSSRMPASAAAISAASSSSEKGRPSAVPCTSTKRPRPVLTMFMSTWAVESSS